MAEPQDRGEIESQVKLLVLSGALPEHDAEKAIKVLEARQRLRDIRFEPAGNPLDAARESLHRVIASLHEERGRVGRLLAELEPLKRDPRCLEAFALLHARFHDFEMACDSLSAPGGPPGEFFMQLQGDISNALRQLRELVDK